MRYLTYLFALLATAAGAYAWSAGRAPLWLWLFTGLFAVVGSWDLLQRRHTLMRNYPVVGRLRWAFESLRPFVRQYLIEDDLHAAPFSREQRSTVYSRAKGEHAVEPFGTKSEVYQPGFEWINHGIAPAARSEARRVRIGSTQCAQPYDSALLNISAMSFGSLGARAIEALNRGARLGGFAHDTGEGSISPYHRHGGDLVWELGSGYFGCRQADGAFDPARFAEQSRDPQVRMIEIKLSQGAKPGHGGVLPGAKVTAEIAATRGVPAGQDCVSPARHPAFSTPLEMMDFIARLRELSGGKPVGFKLCVGHPWEFLALCKAMKQTGIFADFIVVDGKEGGTGAAPEEFSDNVGTPLRDGLVFVQNALVGSGLRDAVRIGASGKIVSGFDMARALALGADWCNAARPFMFALGCVQSLRCHTGHCPTGIATQDPLRQRGLDIEDKAQRVARYQAGTVEALMDLVAATGLDSPADLRPAHINQRIARGESADLSRLYGLLQPGELEAGARDPWYREQWQRARVDSFRPA